MKNITELSTKEYCLLCGTKGYFSEFSMGRCGSGCPCCGQRHFLDWGESTDYRCRYNSYDKSDMRNQFLYCKKCGIIFQLGCIHFSRDLLNSDDVLYNSHLIKKWKHRETNATYLGMPHFETPEDWFNNVNKVDVLEMYCPNQRDCCIKTRGRIEGCSL
jgi:hypothetical protein